MEPLHETHVPRPRPTAKNVAKDPPAIVPEMAGGLEASVSRQSRVTRPTAKLIDGNNHKKPALLFQRAAIAAEIARVSEANEATTALAPSSSPPTPSPQPTPGLSATDSVSSFEPSPASCEPSLSLSASSQLIRSKNKRPIILSSDEDEPQTDGNPVPKKKKTTRKSICKY